MEEGVHRVELMAVDRVDGDGGRVAFPSFGPAVDVHVDRCAKLLGGGPEGFVAFGAVGQTLRRRNPDVDSSQPRLYEPPHLFDGVFHVPQGDHAEPPVPVGGDAAEINHPVVVDAEVRLLELVVLDEPGANGQRRVKHLCADPVHRQVFQPFVGVPAPGAEVMVRFEGLLVELEGGRSEPCRQLSLPQVRRLAHVGVGRDAKFLGREAHSGGAHVVFLPRGSGSCASIRRGQGGDNRRCWTDTDPVIVHVPTRRHRGRSAPWPRGTHAPIC